jgi:hypothetical protein
MTWYQVAMVAIIVISGAIHREKHGAPRKYSFDRWCVDSIVLLTLLSYGGFWE